MVTIHFSEITDSFFPPRNEIRVIFLDTKPINVEERLNKHVHTTGE